MSARRRRTAAARATARATAAATDEGSRERPAAVDAPPGRQQRTAISMPLLAAS
jgi:hypothetical protein